MRNPFHRKTPVLCDERLTHIAFIMDGNGRWARRRGLVREVGHAEGARNLKRILSACRDRGIRIVTVYAFSTENWRRPEKEVDAILKTLSSYLDEAIRDREKNRVRIRVIGDMTPFSEELREKIARAEEETALYGDVTLQIALNYGGRQEIVRAFSRLASEGKTEVTEEEISAALDTAPYPDPDLVVRTSGERRISNFLLWQSAYTEYAFVKTPWPAFSERELDRVISDFYSRHRRFGGL